MGKRNTSACTREEILPCGDGRTTWRMFEDLTRHKANIKFRKRQIARQRAYEKRLRARGEY